MPVVVAHSVFVEPDYVFAMCPDADRIPRACDVRVHHPELGWGRVDIVGGGSFRVRFPAVLAWFSLDDHVVAAWPVENAREFARWCARVPRGR